MECDYAHTVFICHYKLSIDFTTIDFIKSATRDRYFAPDYIRYQTEIHSTDKGSTVKS